MKEGLYPSGAENRLKSNGCFKTETKPAKCFSFVTKLSVSVCIHICNSLVLHILCHSSIDKAHAASANSI